MSTVPSLSFSTSNKRKPILICDGFSFQLNRTRPKLKYWRCKDRTCSAYIHTNHKNQYVGKSGDHNVHLPVPEQVEVAMFKEKVKERVVKETTAIGKIYDKEMASLNLSDGALGLIPLADEAKASLNRLRRQTTPPLPTSSCFDVPDAYSTTTSGAQFLFSDTVVRKKRMMLFATDEQLRMLFSAKTIMIDGTFSASVPHFNQVFSLHCIKYGYNFPCVIGLLPGRTASIYKQVFEFPNAKHSGCFFHYTQCLNRRIQTLGLSRFYNNDEEIRSLCRHLMALPLMPLEDVQRAFETLSEEAPVELQPFFEYFEDWWMKKVPFRLWNVSNLKVKTNNNVESWHSRFNKRIEKNHPNFWSFVNTLKQEEVHFRQQLIHGNSKLKKGVKENMHHAG
ncbi:unnamed protein product [Rotaria socialis]|uniref:FLYWCH-type domain-containing protein n=1 Tax=Rotaria socialis TaxID=392032 RepID=A0A820SYF3_9BILA|nr:unnamed protein product [Rotaria socialis]